MERALNGSFFFFLGEILSGKGITKIESNTSLSSLRLGFFVCDSSLIAATIPDLPAGASTSTGFNLVNMSAYGTKAYLKQILFQNNKIYIRYNSGTAENPTWGSWSIVGDNWIYGGTFLSQSLLPNGKLEDMRTQGLTGIYGFSSTNFLPSDLPTGVQNGAVINFNLYTSVSLQILFDRAGGMKSRFYWYGTWYAWG